MTGLATAYRSWRFHHVTTPSLAPLPRLPVTFAKRTLREAWFPSEPPMHPANETISSSIAREGSKPQEGLNHNSAVTSTATLIPAFDGPGSLTAGDIRVRFTEACTAWLTRSSSIETRTAYTRELRQFLSFVGIAADELEKLATVRPPQVAAWRDYLRERGLSNVAIVRKITVLRSLFSYLQTYGYAGGNPAHSDFVTVPPVPRDGKTVGLPPADRCSGCRNACGPSRSRATRRARVHRLPRRGTHATARDGLQGNRRAQGFGNPRQGREGTAGAAAPRGGGAFGRMACSCREP